jgi:hypothetical protein
MRIEFNVTGSERKSLVAAIGEILEIKPKYLGMPSAAYAVGDFTIDKNGAVVFDGDGEDIETLLANLAQKGFVAEESTNPPAIEEPQHSEDVGLTVAMPREGFTDTAIENLKKLVSSKSALIKKALGVEDLPIEVTEDRISFPWFNPQGDEALVRAYAKFITALCDMAKEQKRVTAKEKPVSNEKYAFRCFLLRLGFIGDEYKAERKILLRNLEGSSAFKGGASDEISE